MDARSRSSATSALSGAGGGGNSRPRANYLRFVPTLLRKNWLLKRKHPAALLLEILTPVLFIVLMDVIRTTSHDQMVPEGFTLGTTSLNLFSPGGDPLIAPYGEVDASPVASPPLLAVPETTLSGLLLHLGYLSFQQAHRMDSFPADSQAKCLAAVATQGMVSLNESSPYALPAVCDGRVSPFKLAVAPDTPFTRAYFMETAKTWYPTVTLATGNESALVIPSLEDSVVFFDTEQAMEEYVASEEYATTAQTPRIFGAIVFDQFPSGQEIGRPASIEYSLRLNGTYVGDDEEVRYVPRTNYQSDASLWDAYNRKLRTADYQQYAANGFLTLQTLVARFANCLPDWDADTQTTTGRCQVNASTAITSDELETRLLQYAADDSATNFAVSLFNELVATDGSGLTSAAEVINSQLEEAARSALLQPLLQAPQPILGALTTPFPIDTFRSSSFYDAVDDVFPIFFVLAYLHPLSKVLVGLISERETRSRELMKILGVNDASITISWYVTYVAILLVGAVLQTVAASINLFPSTSVVLLFLFFFLFSLTVLAFGFLVSAIFSKARTGVYIGFIGFFVLYAVSNAFTDTSPESSKAMACLLAPVGLVFGVQSLATAETSHVGVSLTGSVNNFRFATGLIFFAIDTVLYTLIGLYLEKVVPKEYGTTEKWYFPLQPSYWRRSQPVSRKKSVVVAVSTPRQPLINTEDEFASDEAAPESSELTLPVVSDNIEPPSADLLEQERRGDALVVDGLRKVFSVPGGTKEAVKGLQMSMYAGQITCLLGHNGAGKTTLISMLTGVTSPTAGDASFHGLSLRQDMAAIRESLGVCFQHDVLYPELSVRDHLEFYARVKGFSGEALAAEVEAKVTEVGLADKRDTVASALSGGMKRKLSVAIALLGDSSLVFLDEPTSGMDPYSRRSTWEVLLNNRQDRVLVLTTHFMDEADVLGDRIAIMAEGELQCSGSALYLKNRYGVGYNLTMVKKQASGDGDDDAAESGADAIAFVTRHVAAAKLLSNVGTEIAFQLPLDASSRFPALFRDLDANLNALSLRSYGISVTTMEEVFIKVAEAAAAASETTQQQPVVVSGVDAKPATGAFVLMADAVSDTSSATAVEPLLPSGTAVFLTQWAAMLQKRARIAKRDRKMFVLGLLLPIAWLVLGLALVKVGDITKSDPSLPLVVHKLAGETEGGQVLLPAYCQSESDASGWCDSALAFTSTSEDMETVALDRDVIGSPAYSTDSPTVFGVLYDSPSVNASDATGYQLRVSEAVHSRAFEDGISDQFGAFLVHADSEQRLFGYNVLVNTTLTHAAAVFKASLDESLFRVMMSELDASVEPATLSLTVNNYPLPLSRNSRALFSSFLSFSACLFIVIAFAYFPASIVVHLVRERHPDKNAKHQQLVAGAGIPAFWLANFAFDVAVYVIPCVVALLLLQAFDLGALTGASSCVTCGASTFPSVILLFVAFGLAVVPFAYCWSFVFRDPPSSQTYMIMINFVLGLALLILSFTMQVMGGSTETADKALQFLWRLSPLFCLGRGLLNLTIIEITHLAFEVDDPISTDPFALENTGWPLLFLLFDAALYMALAFAMDYALSFPSIKASLLQRYIPRWSKNRLQNDEDDQEDDEVDEDVADEARRVLYEQETGSSDVIALRHLRKVYRHKAKGTAKGETVAVKDLTFGLPRGECFGFLGINGAGKTTTMKMLTGDIAPTSGGAALAGGLDIATQQLAIRRQIGYCPQFDALTDLLTVREHLELFAKIKGLSPRARVHSEVLAKMEQLGLVEFADRLAGSLSGGNKRKLSVAIALMGEPPILFLDEPSTGMDPVSRRFMWDVIARQSTRRKQSTVVLTTHSMEECEALCSRVGIMVAGALQCLGSVQHLKTRFGDGMLMFDAKLRPPPAADVQQLATARLDSPTARVATREQLTEACGRLGDASWADKITKTHATGYAIASQLDRPDGEAGYVTAQSLAEWWLAETQFEAVAAFLNEHFGGADGSGVELLERKHDSCWFKLKGHAEGGAASADSLRLANVFELVERAKAALGILEYSVSQTTLEQIFNSFASKQQRLEPHQE